MQYSLGPPFFSGPTVAYHSAPLRRRAPVKADDGGKRRLVARLRALAFERLEERRLLTRLVRARAAVDIDVAVEPRAEDVLPDEPFPVRLVDRAFENRLDVKELAADVDVRDLRADRVARNRTALDEQMRIALHEQVILERARLALVGVAGDVARLVRLAIDELPLHTGRKSRAAAAAEA